MAIRLTELLMFSGFMLAAYSIVANKAIQTFGTFLGLLAGRGLALAFMLKHRKLSESAFITA